MPAASRSQSAQRALQCAGTSDMAPRTTLIGLACALTALTACTQVLGLERAELEQGGAGESGASGATAPRSVPLPGFVCEEAPLPACASCLQSCGVIEPCVADEDCRLDLDSYAGCLGTRCNADQEQCALQIDDVDLFDCLRDCADDCVQTRLVAPCELYCACMEQFCASERDVVGDCMDTCQALPAEIRDCRRDHCEWGKGQGLHCQHASDRTPICMPATDGPELCGAGKERTWACDEDSECCSQDCGDGACR